MSTAKHILIGSLIGVGVTAVAMVGVAAALGWPMPHIYKKNAGFLANPPTTGGYWTLNVVGGGSDATMNISRAISVSQAKQIADVLKASVFQTGGPGIFMFYPSKPVAADLTAAPEFSFYQKI
jgi:hypothetical protein